MHGLNIKILALVKQEKDIPQFSPYENIVSIKVDVTKDADIVGLQEFIEEHHINPRILINNAGILDLGLLSTTPVSSFLKIFDVNVFGVHRVTQALLPYIINNRGKIIILGSDSGLVNFKFTSLYSMTKFALEAYADGLSDELTSLGISVTILEPGNHQTPILEKAYRGWKIQETNYEYFSEELNYLKTSTEDAIIEHRGSGDPASITSKIEEIIWDENPRKRYLLTSASESKRVITDNLDKIAMLNKYCEFSFNDDEMHDFLDFSLKLD